MIYNITILLIIAIILLIIKLVDMYLIKEHYENSKFEKIGDIMQQLPDKLQNTNVLDSVENSITELDNVRGTKLSNSKINDKLLNEFLQHMILSDENPNITPIFESSNTDNLLPKIKNGNLNDINNYNHKLRLINNSKKLKQDYLIQMIKYNINKLSNSVKSVDELHDEYKEFNNIQ
jgi:hypothetical protein